MPEVVTSLGNEKDILQELTNSYLFKDILALANIKKPAILEKLLTALALQIGSEVNYNELAKLLEINKKTVESYIQILEQAYSLFPSRVVSWSLSRARLSYARRLLKTNQFETAGHVAEEAISMDMGNQWRAEIADLLSCSLPGKCLKQSQTQTIQNAPQKNL